MKRFMQIFLGLLGVALLSFCVSLGVHYGLEKYHPHSVEKDTAFVKLIAQQTIDEAVNPHMITVGEVYEFHRQVVEEYRCDSIFASIPDDVLTNISKVVIGRQSYATQRDIVMEYDENYRAVYQYLTDDPTTNVPTERNQPEANTTPEQDRSEANTRPITEGRAAGDTVIDGTTYRILATEEHELGLTNDRHLILG